MGLVQLQGLKMLTTLTIKTCELETIPEALSSLSALTSLDLSENQFWKSEGCSWWPRTLSRCGDGLTGVPTCKHSCMYFVGDVECGKLQTPPGQTPTRQTLTAKLRRAKPFGTQNIATGQAHHYISQAR
jgi:hypothetical protein